MPLRPVYGKLSMPVETPQDVQNVIEFALSLSQANTGRATYESYMHDFGDYLYYIGAVCPGYFRPLQETVVALPDEQIVKFADTAHAWLYLLDDAPDSCVDELARRLHDAASTPSLSMLTFTLEQMLAGICTPAALAALADYATRTGKRDEFANLGFWLPAGAKAAIPRFTKHRQALRYQPINGGMDELASAPHPVGLPLQSIMSNPEQNIVVWHYCSIDLSVAEGMPSSALSRLHLISPPLNWDWTVYCTLAADGRYQRPSLSSETSEDEDEMADMRAYAVEKQDTGRGQLTTLPYDDRLTYTNCHTQLTPGVVGDLGGPPNGVYPNPNCPRCGMLMFHVCTVTNDVRSYGDGFRSLFLCENCTIAASHATGWN